MNFQSWKPYLLSPRMARAGSRNRRRSFFVFGGCGFMLLYAMATATGYFMLWSFALMWDAMVLMTYGTVWLYVVPLTWLVRTIKRRRQTARAPEEDEVWRSAT